MKTLLLLIFFILFPFQAFSQILGESVAATPHVLPGDSIATGLPLPGLQIHEFNDYYGDTDKLITGGLDLRLMQAWPHFSYSLGFKGSYITPVLETRNDQAPLDQKIGVHAEQLEAEANLAYTMYADSGLGFKLRLGGGYADVGNHGMVNLYRQIHRAIGSPINDDKFGEQLKGWYKYSSYGATFIIPLLNSVNFNLGASVYNSEPFYEVSYEASVIVSLSRAFALSMSYQFIDQKDSLWWDLTPHRYQYLIGLRLFEVWTPSLMVVSPFVKGDDFGQVYLSLLSLTLPF